MINNNKISILLEVGLPSPSPQRLSISLQDQNDDESRHTNVSLCTKRLFCTFSICPCNLSKELVSQKCNLNYSVPTWKDEMMKPPAVRAKLIHDATSPDA
jgi:hypothetical protein